MHARLGSRQGPEGKSAAPPVVSTPQAHAHRRGLTSRQLGSSSTAAERLAPLIENNPVLAAALGALASSNTALQPTSAASARSATHDIVNPPSLTHTVSAGSIDLRSRDATAIFTPPSTAGGLASYPPPLTHVTSRFGTPRASTSRQSTNRTDALTTALTADPMLLSAAAPEGNTVRSRFGGSVALQPSTDVGALLPSAVSSRVRRQSTMDELRDVIRTMLHDTRTYGSVPTLLMEAYNSVVAAEANEPTAIDGNFFDVVTGESAAMISLRGSRAECASLRREAQRMEARIEDMNLDMHALRTDIESGAKLLKAAEVDEQYAKQRLQEVEDRLQHTAKDFSLERIKVTRLQQQLQQLNQDEDRRFVARTADLRQQLDASRDMLRVADDNVRNQEREITSLKLSLDEQERLHADALRDLDAAQDKASRLEDQVALLERRLTARLGLIKRMDAAMSGLVVDAGKSAVTRRLAAIDGRWRVVLQRSVAAVKDNNPLVLNLNRSGAFVVPTAGPIAGYLHLAAAGNGAAQPKSVAMKPMAPAALNALCVLFLCEIADPHRWRSKSNDAVGHAITRFCKDDRKKALGMAWSLQASFDSIRTTLSKDFATNASAALLSHSSLNIDTSEVFCSGELNVSIQVPEAAADEGETPAPLPASAKKGSGTHPPAKKAPKGARSVTPQRGGDDANVPISSSWALLRDFPGLFEKRHRGGPVGWALLLDAVLNDSNVEPCSATIVGVVMEWSDEFLAKCAEAEALELAELASPSTTEYASIAAAVAELLPAGDPQQLQHQQQPVPTAPSPPPISRSRRGSMVHHPDIPTASSEPGTPVARSGAAPPPPPPAGAPMSALLPFSQSSFTPSAPLNSAPSMKGLSSSTMPPPPLRHYLSSSAFWRVLRNFFTENPSRRLRPHSLLRLRGLAASDEDDAPIVRYRDLFSLKRHGVPTAFADAFTVTLLQCIAGYDAAVRRCLASAVAEEQANSGPESPKGNSPPPQSPGTMTFPIPGLSPSGAVDNDTRGISPQSTAKALTVRWADRISVAAAWATKWIAMDPARAAPAASPFSQSARGEAQMKQNLLGPAPTATCVDAFSAVRAAIDSLEASVGSVPPSRISIDDLMLHLHLGVRAVHHTNTNPAHGPASELTVPFTATLSAAPWLRLAAEERVNASFVRNAMSQNDQAWATPSDVPDLSLMWFGPDPPSAAPSRRGSASHRSGGAPLARRVSTVYTLATLSIDVAAAQQQQQQQQPIHDLWQVVSPVTTIAPASSPFAAPPLSGVSAAATPNALVNSSPNVLALTPTARPGKDPDLCARKLVVDGIFNVVIPTMPAQVLAVEPSWM